MRPIVTDRIAWSVSRSVGLTVTLVSPAKTAALIEMPFGLWVRMGRRNHLLDGGPHYAKGRCHGNHLCLSGVYIGATWRTRLNRPSATAMRPYVKFDHLFSFVQIAIFPAPVFSY